jgi:O-antigen ligase
LITTYKIPLNLLHALTALPFLFLLTNKFPFLQITAISLNLALFFFFLAATGKLKAGSFKATLYLAVIYAYFLLSYLISGQSVSELFSYNFIRRDGNFFFSYLPFLIFSMAEVKSAPIAKYAFIFLVISSVTLGVLGIVEYISGIDVMFVRTDLGHRLMVALNEAHNATGSIYAITFLIVFAVFLFNCRLKWMMGIAVGILFTCLLLTESRGAFLAAIVSVLYLIYLKYGRLWPAVKLTLLFSILGLCFVYLTGAITHLATVTSSDYSSNISRIQLWTTAWKLFLLSPLVGVGFGRYDDYFTENDVGFSGIPGLFYYATQGTVVHSDSHAHNSYLHFLAETGLVGFALVIGFWSYNFFQLRRKFKECSLTPESGFERAFLAGTLSSIVCLFFLSITEHYMAAPTVMIAVSSITAISLNLKTRV